MARVALIDPAGRAVTTVEAVLGRNHDIVVRRRIHAPGDVELVIADLRPGELADQSTLRGLASFAPVLLLVDRRQPIPPSVEETAALNVLRKPFDAFELRLRVDKLLEAARQRTAATPSLVPAQGQERDDSGWLEFPFVPAPAGAVLRRAARLTAPLWILGEPGCGRRRVATAVCRVASPSTRIVTLHPDEDLAFVLERESGSGGYALLIPEIENRPLHEQERLASLLAVSQPFRLICTSVDDPAERVLDGTFSRGLYQHLIGLAVQIQPLRERPITIPPLVQALSRSISRSLGGPDEVSFSPDAMARLQTYMWPGNILELESVLVRTLTMSTDLGAGATIEAGQLLFTPDDGFGRREGPAGRTADVARLDVSRADEDRRSKLAELVVAAKTPSESAPPLDLIGQRARPEESPAAAGDSTAEAAAVLPSPSSETPLPALGLESFVAGLAHDLRNPMVAIKTFASAIGSEDPESAADLGRIAGDACDRIEDDLEALTQFADFGEPVPALIEFGDLLRAVVIELPEDIGERVELDTGHRAESRVDSEQMRFVFENLLFAALAEAGAGERVRVALGPANAEPDAEAADGMGGGGAGRALAHSLVFETATGGGPVAKLRKYVRDEDRPPSWRVLLAASLAERNGCEVDVEFAAEGATVRCLLPGGEEKTRGEQTSRFNR